MTTASFVALVLPVMACYLLLARRWGSDCPISPSVAAALAPGVGLGLSSCLYFFLLIATGRGDRAATLDFGFWVIVIVLLGVDRWRSRSGRSRSTDGNSPWKKTQLIAGDRLAAASAAVVLLILGSIALAAFWRHYLDAPHGEWDAWAVWNLRARAILRGAPDWSSIFSADIAWSSPDYPLLIPLTVARLWEYSGRESTLVPAIVAGLFTAGSLAFLVAAIGKTSGWAAALLGGAALLTSSAFVFQAGCQCGDLPLAFFMLVAIALVSLSLTPGTSPFLIGLAGLTSALAAWTKNDGQVLIVVMGLFLIACWRKLGVRPLLHFAAGAALPLATLGWFKLSMAPSSNLFRPDAVGDLPARLIDGSRWMTMFERVGELLPAWGGMRGSALVVLLAVGILARPSREGREEITRAAAGLLLVTAVMAVYLAVYVITPTSLDTMVWHISTSLERLLTQLWPAIIWSIFQLSSRAKSLENRTRA
jgi:hypothetical protein